MLVTDGLQLQSTWDHVHDAAVAAIIEKKLARAEQDASGLSILQLVRALSR